MPRPCPVAVLVALREEMRAVEPGLRGLGATVRRLGIGKQNAERRASLLVAELEPRWILVCGFGGGLTAAASTGKVLVATEVLDEESGERWCPPAELLGRVREELRAFDDILEGRLVTVSRVLSTAADKTRMGETTGAQVVDMESAGVLRVARAAGIPTLCLRAVLDEHNFELPLDFGEILTPEGRPRVWKTARAIAARPSSLGRLLELRAKAQGAAAALGRVVPPVVGALRKGDLQA